MQLSIRQDNRQRSVEAIKQLRSEQSKLHPQELPTDAETQDGIKKSGKLKAISVEEEAKLLKYYACKIQDICRALGLPQKVLATALVLLKRAYLNFSALDHDPKNIMLTCIYLAGKIEESYIGAEEFCRVVKQEQSVVLQGEIVLLEGLMFDLIVYTPYRALQGFCLELEGTHALEGAQPAEDLKGVGSKRLEQIKIKAQAAADALMLTDAPLLFPPGQLALAALRSGMKSVGEPFDAFLEAVASNAAASSSRDINEKAASLREALQQIDALGVAGASPVNEEEVRKIDRKLKLCHNLLTDPSSKEYQKAATVRKQRETEAKAQKAAAKRARIAASEAALLGFVQNGTELASLMNAENGRHQQTDAGQPGGDRPAKRLRMEEGSL